MTESADRSEEERKRRRRRNNGDQGWLRVLSTLPSIPPDRHRAASSPRPSKSTRHCPPSLRFLLDKVRYRTKRFLLFESFIPYLLRGRSLFVTLITMLVCYSLLTRALVRVFESILCTFQGAFDGQCLSQTRSFMWLSWC